MRATMDISDSLINELLRVTGEKKKARAIRMALNDYVRNSRKEKVVALSGKIACDLDWRNMEETELTGMKKREKRRKSA